MASYSEMKKRIKQNGISNEEDKSEYQKIKEKYKSGGYSFDLGVDEDYIKSFINAAESFIGSAKTDYESIGWGNASSTYDTKYSTYSDLYSRGENIRVWLNANKGKLDEKTYNSLSESLASISSGTKSAMDSFEETKKYYSQWETEEDYNNYQIGWLDEGAEITAEGVKARQAKYQSNKDRIAQIDKEIDELGWTWWFTDEEEKKQALKDEKEALEAENNKYDQVQGKADKHYMPITDEVAQVASNRDFSNATMEELWQHDAEFQKRATSTQMYDYNGNIVDVNGKIIYDANDPYVKALRENNKDAFYNSVIQDKLGMFLSASEDDKAEAYNRISVNNGDTDTWARLLQEGSNNAWNELTTDELTTYYYKLNVEGQAAAYQYLDDLTVTLTKRATQKRAEDISDAKLLEQIALNMASIPMNVFGGAVALMSDLGNAIEGNEYNPYSAGHAWSNDASAIRQDTAMDINEATGNAALPWVGTTWGDVYQSLMSAGDSATGLLIGSTGYGVLMGMSSASSEMKDLYERGASTEQMISGGILAGAAEMVFEKVSIDSLVKMGDSKTIGAVIKNLLKQGGIEASEEMFTEIANTITDAIVMGSQTEWVDMKTFVKNVVNAGIGGFISGGAMGGAYSSIGKLAYNQQVKQHGQGIIDTMNGVDSLHSLALDMAGVNQNKEGQKIANLADKVADKASAKNVGRLSVAMQDTFTAQNKADVQNALVKKGLSEKEAKRVAEYLTGTSELTAEQKAEIESNANIKAVVEELVNNPKSAISERARNLIYARMGAYTNTSNITSKATNSGKMAVKVEADVKNKVSESGKTTRISTGEEITIDKNNAIAKIKTVDGERVVYLNTDQGVVEASDVNYASEEEGLIYESLVDMNPAFSNAVIKNYDGSVPIQTYINGMREGIILYGMHNFQAVGKDISKSSYLAELSKADQDFALKLGRAYAKAEAKKASAPLRKAMKNAEQRAASEESAPKKVKGGKVSFENGVKAKTRDQKRSVRLAKYLSSAIGIDITFYDASTTSDSNGKGANGYFDEKTNSIHLDLQNAHNDTKTIAFTMSHEVVHFIKKWSPEKFNTFAKFLMEQYAEHGVDTSTLLSNKMAELGTTNADLAYEEMICDACETMLLDSNAVVKLMQLRQTDLDLFEKLKMHILELLNNLREAYRSFGYENTTDEAKALLKMTDVLDQFYSLFEEAAVDATQSFQTAQTLNTESVSVSEDGTVRLQMKQYQQTGRATLLNYLREQYGNENANDLILTIDNIYDAMKEIKNDEALSVFSNWQDTEVELDENGHPIFTTSINNGDYELNQDFSRVCKKRRQLDFVLNMLAEDPAFEASHLTKQDFVKINKAIKAHGFEIACALCFVDSKRFRQAEWADSFANTWNDILNAVVKDSSKLTPFNFATKNPNLADDGIEIDTSKSVTYRKWSDGKEDVKNRRTYESFEQMLSKDKDGKWLEGNTNVRTIATLIRDNPELRHTFRGADIIASKGFDTIQRLAPGIRSILDGWGGSSVPKPSSNDASYDSSIINMSGYNKTTAYAMGGVRMNSFSDFMAHMFFDYCQAFADLSAKELPSQAYTKELIYVRLFGRSGQKINMSGIAAIRDDSLPTTASKGVTKAEAEANEKIEKMIAGLDVTRLLEHLNKDIYQLTEADVEQFLDMCDYVWADESINMKHATLLQTGILYDKLSESKVEECYELLKAGEIEQALKVAGKDNVDAEYAKNCGTIVVGVSDAHIRKLLRDPTVRMVIPYHKSGLNPIIARELRISAYNDYTLTQTTGVKRKGSKTSDKIGSKAIKDAYGLKDFAFYDWFGKTIDGKLYDGKATADKYLEWCEKGYYDEKVGDYVYYTTKGDGYILAKDFHKKASIVPKFDAFVGEENYYKVLEDFDCYDTITGEHSAQGAVDFLRNGLPSDYKDVIVGALKEEQKVHDDFKDHLDNKGLKDEVMEIVKARGYEPSVKKQAKKKSSYEVIEDDVKKFATEINLWVKDGRQDGVTFILGSTGDVLQGLGAIESDIYILGDKIKTILSEHPEISIADIKRIPQIIGDPVLILKSRNVGRRSKANSRLVIFGTVKAGNGSHILSVLDLKPVEKGLVIDDMQKVNSVYTKTDPASFVSNSDVVYADKNRTTSLLRAIGFQMPIALQQSGYIGSISYYRDIVNIHGKTFSEVVTTNGIKKQLKKDSLGNTLSDEQVEFFKDSKVRDENGQLMYLYHGTKRGGFTTFEDTDDIGYFFTDRETNAGTYSGTYTEYAPKRFRNWEEAISFAKETDFDLYYDEESSEYVLADGWSETRWAESELDDIADELNAILYGEGERMNYAVYLNLKDPLVINGNGSNWDNVIDYYEGGEFVTYEDLTEEQIEGFLDNGYDEDELRPFTNNGYESLPIFDVANFNITYPMTTREWVAEAQAGEFDGVIFKDIIDSGGEFGAYSYESNVYVALNPNQIKSVANTTPTSNPDIRYQKKRNPSSYAPTFYSQMGKVIDEIKMDKIGASSLVNYLKGKGIKHDEIKWSGIEAWLEGKKSVTKAELQEFVAGSQLEIAEEMTIDEDDGSIVLWQSPQPDVKVLYIDGKKEDIFRRNSYGHWVSDELGDVFFDERDILEQVKSDYGKNIANTRWSQYKLDGGTNYRELVFVMPNSTYSNNAMKAHWGQDAEGVLAHARIQDMTTTDGKKMLFIEEIQSDWHNEGHTRGYVDESKLVSVKNTELRKANHGFYELYHNNGEYLIMIGEARLKERFPNGISEDDIHKGLVDKYNSEQRTDSNNTPLTPDAPFRDTYHEYVLKRLLRMAAEEGYDSLGWTPSDIQSKRWSDEFAEGYRIEYDQDIPKFLRKYGKKWGATVGKTSLQGVETKETYYDVNREDEYGSREAWEREVLTNLVAQGMPRKDLRSVKFIEEGNYLVAFDKEHMELDRAEIRRSGDSVWSMDITEPMEQSVLYEGQAKFQKKKLSNRTVLSNALESSIDTSTQEGQNELRWLKDYQGKIALIEKEEAHLAEVNAKIKEISFTKGSDRSKLNELNADKNRTANRINTYDKQLMRLETMKPIKDVLAREKELVRKRTEEKGREKLNAYREREAEKTRKLLDKVAESRKKGIESRNKTALRHKIKDVVNELNQYLLNGTKDKHVPIELQKAVAEALNAVNMDTVGAEGRIAKLRDDLMKAKTPETIQEISRKIEHIQEMGGNMDGKLKALKDAYDSIISSDDPLIANSHDEVISNSIANVIKDIGSTPLRDMSLNQLEEVYDMYKMVLTSIRKANATFKMAKSVEISTLANRVIEELISLKTKKHMLQGLSEFSWNSLKPIYALERIGSDTLTELFNNVRAGEDTWATDMNEAQEFRTEVFKKYGYDSWNFDKPYSFTTKSGNTFELTLGDIMSLYAYSKDPHAKNHLTNEGFVFDPKKEVVVKTKAGIKVKQNLSDATAYNISEETLADIVSTLDSTQGAKEFVDAMQDYLSTTMGEKGNEVSLALYGIKLFKNKVYFPLKSAPQYMAVAKEKAQGEVKIKNKGFTKDRQKGAKNPIVLTSFMDVWSDHVTEMSMYHAFTLALEDFYRVFNYKAPGIGDIAPVSVNSSLENAHGNGATQYIDQLLKDLNGGARTDSTAGIINKLIGLFKKSAVFASASVVIQQPSAVTRAMALMDAKYFVGTPTMSKHSETWAEVKKYAPVAIIKEMGYFDTGMGRSSAEWLKGEKTLKDKVDDFASKAPALADELSWCYIWKAVKREVMQTHKGLDPNSEAFLKAVGERFTEVVTKTQVYDSVLSRSAMMRSKDTGMKMATAFMAEPTTSLNMLTNALIQGKRGNGKQARKAVGAVVASMILNSILVSFVYAGRDDDEDKTYAEKYVGTLTEELIDSFNPLTLIPFVKDIVSIVQGYDVERSDMAVITDIINAWNNLDSDNRSAYRKVEDFAGAIASIFGLPVKNIMRDARAIYNTVNSFVNGEKTTGVGIGNAIKEGVTGKEISDSQQLYEAIISGDSVQIDRVKGRFKDQKSIDSAIRKALCENDSRIKEAAEARYNGNTAEYMRIAKEIIAEGNFSQDNIVAAINAEINALDKDESTTTSSDNNKAESIFKMDDYYAALIGRDEATAYAVKEDIINTDIANGKDREEAEDSFNSRFTSHLRELYEKGELTDSEAREMLINYGGKTEEQAYSKVQHWAFKQDYPEYDDLSEEAVKKYYEEVEPYGIGINVYYDYSKQRAKCKGIDSNGDGKTDSGSVKSEVMQVINSLPITSAQKDALYFLNGWSRSTLWQAPWH